MLLRFASTPLLFTFTTLLAAAPLVACTSSTDPGPDATITVVNDESFAITDIYIDNVGDETFSDNLLGNDPLLPGEQITFGLDCGFYDVELIDELDGQCIAHDQDLCLNDAVMHIDDDFCTFSAFRDGKQVETKIPHVKAASAPITK